MMDDDVKKWLDHETPHYECEDCWYSCALLTCDDHRKGSKCDCGADEQNEMRAKLKELLRADVAREPTPIGIFWQTVSDGKWHFNEGVFCKDDIHDNGRPIKIALLGEEAPQSNSERGDS